MRRIFIGTLILISVACKQKSEPVLTAQQIIDKSIKISGGENYAAHNISFLFRDRKYVSETKDGQKILKRITYLDSATITDVKTNSDFRRYVNDTLINLSDSIANRYASSVNSVHYFVRLPFGLNDGAVHKELIGEETIKEKNYYKIKVTFDENNGGEDFEDVYMYWFNKETLKPDYLAYNFHVNGGGQRFREAYNERYVNGIRFVDYNNYKSETKENPISNTGKQFEKNDLELLSKIEITAIEVIKN